MSSSPSPISACRSPSCGALAERGITEPFAIQSLVIGDVLDGRDVLAKSPTGSGKTLAFGAPIDRRARANGRRAGRARARADARARQPDRRGARGRSPTPAALKVAAVYGGVGFDKQIRDARARAHPRRHARPARGPARTAAPSRSPTSSSSSSTRPTACSTWASARPSTASSPSARRTARRCSSRATLDGEAGRIARASTRTTPCATSTRRRARARRRHRAPLPSRSTRDDRIDALVDELRRRPRPRARLRPHQARRRPARQAPRHARACSAVAMHGNKSQNQRERALAALRRGPASTRSSRPTSPPAASTSTASRTSSTSTRPDDREGYVHRIGRTGRAGRTGIGITFVEAEQARDVGRIAAALRLHGEFESAGLASAPRPHATGGRQQPPPPRAAPARQGRAAAHAVGPRPASLARRRLLAGDRRHVVGDLLDLAGRELVGEGRHARRRRW